MYNILYMQSTCRVYILRTVYYSWPMQSIYIMYSILLFAHAEYIYYVQYFTLGPWRVYILRTVYHPWPMWVRDTVTCISAPTRRLICCASPHHCRRGGWSALPHRLTTDEEADQQFLADHCRRGGWSAVTHRLTNDEETNLQCLTASLPTRGLICSAEIMNPGIQVYAKSLIVICLLNIIRVLFAMKPVMWFWKDSKILGLYLYGIITLVIIQYEWFFIFTSWVQVI